MKGKNFFDVIIVGAGPAGLNAALILGRCMRKVAVFDSGNPRNFRSQALHGFLSRDGIHPLELLRIAREELRQYDVTFIDKEVMRAMKNDFGNFIIADEDNQIYEARKILLATGLIDQLPNIKDIDRYYGKSVFHCPYCDGWEVRYKKLAVYGNPKNGGSLALSLTTWSDDVILLTHGKRVIEEEVELLANKGIKVVTSKISRLEGKGGMISKIYFEDGRSVDRDVMFFTTGKYQRSNLAEKIGCRFTEKGLIYTDSFGQTSVPGVFAAGDASKDMQMVIIAAAEGAKAGIVINKTFIKEEKEIRKLKRILKDE